MVDAKVIGMDGRARSARTVLAGADRASGERVRRRRQTTPLLSGADADTRASRAAAKAPAPAAATTPGATPGTRSAAKKTAAGSSATARTTASTVDPATAAKDPATRVPTGQAAQNPVPRTAVKRSAAQERAATELADAKHGAAARQAPAPGAAAPKATAKKASTKKASTKNAAAKTSTKDTAAKATTKNATAKKAPARKAPVTKTTVKQSAAQAKQLERIAAASAPSRPAANRVIKPAAASTTVPPIPSRPVAAQVREPDPTTLDEPLPSGGRHSVAMAIAAQAGQMLLDAVISRAKPAEIESKVAAVLSFVRHRLTGDYELDEFGFDPEFTKIPLAILKPLYKYWFRVEVRGIENIPADGGGLVVANHSGTLPMDAIMTAVAIQEATPEHRFLRTLGADLVFQTPFLAGLARRAGATLASNPDAERLLSGGHLVGVWPEGFKGIGKPFSERYKLQRFGRGGFVSAALRTGTPIIPCSIVGAEEIYPIIGDIPSLARLLGLPYVPVTPFFPLLGPLGAIPLPSKWLIEFGPPVETASYGASAADDPMLVFDLTDQVRQSIQQTLYSLLVQRRSIFF